jgi:hypothetical protein
MQQQIREWSGKRKVFNNDLSFGAKRTKGG